MNPDHQKAIDEALLEGLRELEDPASDLNSVLEKTAARLELQGFRGAGLAVAIRAMKEPVTSSEGIC